MCMHSHTIIGYLFAYEPFDAAFTMKMMCERRDVRNSWCRAMMVVCVYENGCVPFQPIRRIFKKRRYTRGSARTYRRCVRLSSNVCRLCVTVNVFSINCILIEANILNGHTHTQIECKYTLVFWVDFFSASISNV